MEKVSTTQDAALMPEISEASSATATIAGGIASYDDPLRPEGFIGSRSPPPFPCSSSAPTSPRIHRMPNTMKQLTPQHSPNVRQQRPLSTYTSLGSPIHRSGGGRMRSLSLGTTASASYQNRSVPNAPNYYGIGNPQASGMGGLLVPHPPFATNGMMSTTTTAPPELSHQRKAMEAACAAERSRAKVLEEEELYLTADELRAVLKKERLRTSKIQADLAALRSGTVQQQLQAEVLEEGRINGLMRRMDVLQEEKGRIIVELEREEEMVRTTVLCE
jgi:hypothetical protein